MQSDLGQVVDEIPGVVWSAGPDGSVDRLNRRWCEFTGLSVAEGFGEAWQSAIHPEDLPELLERWRSILASGEPGEIEARFQRSDGEYRWFLIRAVPVRDERGNVARWYGINADIHDRAIERQRFQASLTQALDELRKSEARLRTIIDTIPTIVWRALPDGSGEFWNQRWHDYTGLSHEAARGWGWQTVIHPDDVGRISDVWLTHLATGQACEVEGRLRRFDGEYRWFLFRAEPLRDETGNIVSWYGANTDIDDRKCAEALLAGEHRLLEMVASGTPLLLVLDALCRLLDATAEGCSTSILLLDRTLTRVHRAVGPGLPSSYNEALEGRSISSAAGPCGMAATLKEQVIVSDVGRDARWDSRDWPALAVAHGLKSCWSTPILSSAGESLGTFAIYQRNGGSPTPFHQALIRKLSHIATIAIERTRHENALKRGEAFLAEAQHLSATGSFSWRVSNDEIMWSEQLYRIFGFDRGTPLTLELISTRVHPEDLPMLMEQFERARRDGSDMECEFRLQMPDRSVKYLHTHARSSRDERGQLEYIGAVQDVTGRRVSEDTLSKVRSELAQMARLTSLGAMTASIAHEVNQPVSGIITNASTCLRMLAADPPNVEGARETARRTIRDGHRASDVITRVRALFAKKTATIESVDLNEATREVIALSLSDLQRNRVILRAELADDLPPVSGDRIQLQQVILNLLLNASDAMSGIDDRPRQLVIRAKRDERDRVQLTVQDAGVGFDPQDMDRLFEAFFTTKSRGMGIGLSVSRSIIESHHGRLWAALNDGPGATFSFSIPCAHDEGIVVDGGAFQLPAVTNADYTVRNP